MNTENVLVIILAETRAYDLTFDLFKRNVLNNYHADLAICIASNEREVPGNPYYTNAKYVWTYPEPDDWGSAFDYMQENLGGNSAWRRLLKIRDQWLGGIKGENEHQGSGGILLFLRWFLKHSIQSEGILNHYDRYIITRSDYIHKIAHPPLSLLDANKIWIPNGEQYGGYTDRHIVVSRKHVMEVLGMADIIGTAPELLFQKMNHHKHWNLEKFIKFSFAQKDLLKQVRYFPYIMYTVREANGHTRWASGIYVKKLGYFIKYMSEYRRFRLSFLFVKESGDWTKGKIRLLNIIFGLLNVVRAASIRLKFTYRYFRRRLRVRFRRLTNKR
ncbi:MAG: hypothetical protein GY746_06060 [Gammaproteobacteria bacterium]|nr:hypothetical protein [Gammaproteobacteria bacterium]